MNVSLTKFLEQEVRDLVKTGKYSSTSEVIRESLRLLLEREHAVKARNEAIQRSVELGRLQADRVEGISVEPGKLAETIKAIARAGYGTLRKSA